MGVCEKWVCMRRCGCVCDVVGVGETLWVCVRCCGCV